MNPVRKENFIFYLMSITLATFPGIKNKYIFLSRVSGKSVAEEINKGVVQIAGRYSILQYAIFKKGGIYRENFDTRSMAQDFNNILEHFDRYGGVNFEHDPANLKSELIPMQSDIIEFVALRYLSQWFTFKDLKERADLSRETYTLEEMVKATGYKKSYLYKLRSQGKLVPKSSKGSKLFFGREEVEKLMHSVPEISLDDII